MGGGGGGNDPVDIFKFFFDDGNPFSNLHRRDYVWVCRIAVDVYFFVIYHKSLSKFVVQKPFGQGG